MNENKDYGRYEDDEIEIDLMELASELKNNFKFIFGFTSSFIVAAAVYSFIIAKPVYGYNAVLRVPNYNINLQNTCVEVLKQDVGQNGLTGVTLMRGTALVNLNFNGKSPEKVTADAKDYLPKAVGKVQKIVDEYYGAYQLNDIVSKDQMDLLDVKSKTVINTEVISHLDIILKRLDEKNAFPKVALSVPDNASNIPVTPNKPKNLAVSFAAGLFLSCGWIIARYIFRKEREEK